MGIFIHRNACFIVKTAFLSVLVFSMVREAKFIPKNRCSTQNITICKLFEEGSIVENPVENVNKSLYFKEFYADF